MTPAPTGEGDALVSAGNTGASVLACARRWTLLQGVRRAPLAAVYPTELRRGEKDDPFSLILDVGATVDVTAEDLVGFAVMGSAYAKLVSSNRRPRVALLSNGTEAGKGPASIVAAHAALVETRAQLHRQHRGPRHPARRGRRRGDVGLRRQRRAEDARGRLGDGGAARALRAQGAAPVAARAARAVVGDRSAQDDVALVILMALGLAMITTTAVTNTLLQTLVPDGLRGRVISVYTFSFVGMAQIGAFLGGTAAERFGVAATLGVGGVLTVAAAMSLLVRSRELQAAR